MDWEFNLPLKMINNAQIGQIVLSIEGQKNDLIQTKAFHFLILSSSSQVLPGEHIVATVQKSKILLSTLASQNMWFNATHG